VNSGRKRDLFAIAEWLPKAKAQYESGMSYAQIGAEVGVTRASVQMILKRYYPDMVTRRAGCVAKPKVDIKAVQAAFVEGFQLGVNHNNVNWKHPPIGIAWLDSNTRNNYLLYTPAIAEAIQRWRNAKRTEQQDVPLEEMP
jgi:hypothetical protein